MVPDTNQPAFVCSSPSKRSILPEEVHLWLARLDASALQDDALGKHLSLEERNKAERFKFDRDRIRYIVAHGFLRSILSSYLDVSPADLTFASGLNGKPMLRPLPHAKTIQFNLSHSYEMALIAVTHERDIGVDLEHIDENFAFDEIARRFFFPSELATLDSLPLDIRREAFFRIWTCKEALVKAKGTGLGSALDEITISQTAGNTLVLRNVDPDWSLTELTPAPGYVGALGVQGHGWRLKCWQWQTQAATTS